MPDMTTFQKDSPRGVLGVPQMVCPLDWGARAQGECSFLQRWQYVPLSAGQANWQVGRVWEEMSRENREMRAYEKMVFKYLEQKE